jgi:LAO/AO transport system kinase
VTPSDPLLEAIRRGEPRALARAITRIENREESAEGLLRQLFPESGRATLLGLTGAPGAGKSTLADAVATLLRARGQSVGIVAVDPTSPFSGGAILGDLIRSMATRGALGGLATAAADVALLLDAAGKDMVLIETVGVGQDEVDIVRLADVTVVILVPGMGDDVQTIKAGIMEIADVFAINKADRPGADRVEQELRAMLSIGHRPDGWQVPIVKTVAADGKGVPELLDATTSYIAFLRDRGLLASKKVVNWRQRLLDLLRERLLARAVNGIGEERLADLAARVARREMDPYSAVDAIMQAHI